MVDMATPTPISITILVISVPLSIPKLPTTLVLSMITRDVFAMLWAQERVIALRTIILSNPIPKQILILKVKTVVNHQLIPILMKTQ